MVFSLIIVFTANVSAQTQLLRKAIEKINDYNYISYDQILKDKSHFGDDTLTLTIKSSVSRTLINGKKVELSILEDMRGFTDIYNGSTQLNLDLNTKTFRIYEVPRTTYSPFYWASFIETNLQNSPEIITVLSDTVINRTKCYHIKFSLADKAPDFDIYDLYLNKDTYLPVYTRQFLQGKIRKGNYTSDAIVSMVTSRAYSNYKIDPKKFPDLSSLTIPADFNPEKKINLLSTGQKAPSWNLTDAKGTSYSSDSLKGKVTLIEFTFNSCAACALAIPVLNRLEEKYKKKNVQIININSIDSKESVLRFANKHKIEYPTLINAKATAKSFQVSGYPTFYLIDHQGKIVSTIEGFNDKLESDLIDQIDKLL